MERLQVEAMHTQTGSCRRKSHGERCQRQCRVTSRGGTEGRSARAGPIRFERQLSKIPLWEQRRPEGNAALALRLRAPALDQVDAVRRVADRDDRLAGREIARLQVLGQHPQVGLAERREKIDAAEPADEPRELRLRPVKHLGVRAVGVVLALLHVRPRPLHLVVARGGPRRGDGARAHLAAVDARAARVDVAVARQLAPPAAAGDCDGGHNLPRLLQHEGLVVVDAHLVLAVQLHARVVAAVEVAGRRAEGRAPRARRLLVALLAPPRRARQLPAALRRHLRLTLLSVRVLHACR